MSVANTHGGYFTPKGFFKVEEGGSHEENPNGGVQVGTDEQGIPNLLEEGEPVYNDYVFSDNIYAEGGILEKHKLPKGFAGKLYSEIADNYADEAEERPLDPISNNGLNAMLVRLMEAQEEQKTLREQREIEEELANMSPEELSQLETMLAQPEHGVAPEQSTLEPVVSEQVPIEGQPKIFATGGPKEKAAYSYYPLRSPGGNEILGNWHIADYIWPMEGTNEEKPIQEIVTKQTSPVRKKYRSAVRTGFVAPVPTLDVPEIDESLYRVGLQDNNPLNNPIYATALANVDKPVLTENQKKTLEHNGTNITNATNSTNGMSSNYPLYNTGLRYAGAIGSALGALYNSAQKPTRFTLPDIDVVVPTGSIRQQYQRYQSIDPALYQNALAAQTNAQRRALINSGLGPSVTPALTALDSSATGAMGSAVINGIADANNRRNAVITANNGADAQKAAFDYQVMAARAQAINQAKNLRSRYDILVQQLNDAATTEQYQAISKELDAVKQALSAIGRENFVLNQVNTNEALRYGANPGGIAYYKTLLKNYGE